MALGENLNLKTIFALFG